MVEEYKVTEHTAFIQYDDPLKKAVTWKRKALLRRCKMFIFEQRGYCRTRAEEMEDIWKDFEELDKLESELPL